MLCMLDDLMRQTGRLKVANSTKIKHARPPNMGGLRRRNIQRNVKLNATLTSTDIIALEGGMSKLKVLLDLFSRRIVRKGSQPASITISNRTNHHVN